MELWNCLKPSAKGDTFVRCSTYQTDFSCTHDGRFDCKHHIETKGHKDFYKLKTNNKSMTEFCGNAIKTCNSAKTRRRNQTKAELILYTIIAQMNHET